MSRDSAWKHLELVTGWVRFADSKAATVLAGSGVLAGLLIQQLRSDAGRHATSPSAIFLILALLLLAGAVTMAFFALLPSVSHPTPSVLIFFGDVAREYPNREKEFSQEFVALMNDEDRQVNQVARQVWSLSLIASRKFRYTTVSTVLAASGLSAAGIGAFLSVVWA